jgi:hypothetical protein
MAHLAFYRKEKELYKEAYEKEICGKEIEIVFEKLRRHYKLHLYLTRFSRHNGHCIGGTRIDVPYRTTFGLLCHEISHAIDHKKRSKSKHDKKLMRVIGRVIAYCKKKNWWEGEIAKRTKVKPPPPQPTKDEARARKIEKRNADILRYEKKLKYYTKLYSNKIKKARRSIAGLQRFAETKPS